MRFTNREFVSLIRRLQNLTNEIVDSYSDRNTILGIIGEKFVGYCICHGLWKLGYICRYRPYPRSYFIQPKFGANEEGIGGVDYLLTIVSSREQRHKILIEVKNWANYRITPNTYKTEILDRFTRVDDNNECDWIVTMNSQNIPDIGLDCILDDIYVLPMVHQITPESVNDNNALRVVFGEFIDAFCSLITRLAPEPNYPYMNVETGERDRTDGVTQDLLMGVSYNIISHRYGVTKGYISKIASDIRRWQYPLPDRRNKNWRIAMEVQD